MSLDAGTKQAFWDYYRVGENDLAAFFLDRDRALPHIQNTARAAKLGGYGYTQGVGLSQAEAERLATSSIGDADLRGTLGTAIDVSRDAGKLGQIYGDNYNLADASNELFFADTNAKRKRERLSDRERGQFAGQSGIGRGSLGQQSSY
jgi:hypothetical protein